MQASEFRLNQPVNTPHGKAKVIMAEVQRTGKVFDESKVRVTCFFEANAKYPQGIERNFMLDDLSAWTEPAPAKA